MKEIFIGHLFDKNKEKELLKICPKGVSMAVNQYQMGFVEGLNKKIDIISGLIIGSYPKKCKKFSFKREKSNFEYGTIEYLPFKNFYFIKERMFYKHALKLLKEKINKDEETILYVYGLYLPYLKVIRRIKRIFSNLKVCLIITDLPGKYGFLANQKSLSAIKDRLQTKKKLKLASFADSYVFLTEQMTEIFPKRPYSIIEGFFPQCDFEYNQNREEKTILYTGSLQSAFGIDNLLKAFSKIEDKDYSLWICGAGGIQSTVEEYAKNDKRIKYFGFLKKEEITKLQAECDVLINPRQDNAEYTKYSFPSKTMEYLLSGSKVLMYKLAGVPQEYYDYIYTIDGNEIDDLKNAIVNTCEDKSFYPEKSQKQVAWIKENKNAKKQIEKLKEIK